MPLQQEQAIRSMAVPPGKTCKFKTAVKDPSVQRTLDLPQLYAGCKKLSARYRGVAFVLYPKGERQSNCWLCQSRELKDSNVGGQVYWLPSLEEKAAAPAKNVVALVELLALLQERLPHFPVGSWALVKLLPIGILRDE